MSHFAVAVIVHDGGCLDGLLAPYQENNMGDCPRKYLEFVSVEEEYRERYETEGTRKVQTPDGRLLWPWDEELRVPGTIGTGSGTHKVPEGYEEKEIKFTELYPTFETFMVDYAGYDDGPDPEAGKYGYWENPNRKWDWWQVGGRYSNWFKTKDGREVDGSQVKDLDLSPNEETHKKALRFWEIVVEGAELLPGEEEPFSMWKPAYYLDQYGDKETYAADQSSPAPWAFITPDGVWHEKGEMGWFAFSDATQDSRKTFREAWTAAIAAADPEDWVVIVDCHI